MAMAAKGTKFWTTGGSHGQGGHFPLTPLLGNAVQPSSAWDALESRRTTKQRGEDRCQKATAPKNRAMGSSPELITHF